MRKTTIRQKYQRRLSLEGEHLESRRVLATLAGQVVEDVDGDGTSGADEPGIADIRVYDDANGNGVLDLNGTFVEPDDFADHAVAANENMTLSVVGTDNQSVGKAVRAKTDDLASTGSKVFGYGAGAPGEDVSFFHKQRRMRVDFSAPVSSVSIDFIASRDGESGILEAYDENGTMIGSSGTAVLTFAGAQEKMSVDGGAISYVVAYNAGESGLRGRLDNLRVDDAGSEIWTVTDAEGNYSMDVDAGSYDIDVVVPESMEKTFPTGSSNQTVGQDDVVSGIDFGLHTPSATWQNVAEPNDVDNSGSILPRDVILIINEINQPVHADGVTGRLPPPPNGLPNESERAFFFDVNGDGFVTAGDAVRIINYLNATPGIVAAAVSANAPTTAEVSAALVDDLASDEDDLHFGRHQKELSADAALDLTHDRKVFLM